MSNFMTIFPNKAQNERYSDHGHVDRYWEKFQYFFASSQIIDPAPRLKATQTRPRQSTSECYDAQLERLRRLLKIHFSEIFFLPFRWRSGKDVMAFIPLQTPAILFPIACYRRTKFRWKENSVNWNRKNESAFPESLLIKSRLQNTEML